MTVRPGVAALVCVGWLVLLTAACTDGRQSADRPSIGSVRPTAEEVRSTVEEARPSPAAAPATSTSTARDQQPPAADRASAGPLVIAHTDGSGAWLRREPAGDRIEVWPEGATMVPAGEESVVDGRSWRKVRTSDGAVGWMAADYLATADAGALLNRVSGPTAPRVGVALPPADPRATGPAPAGRSAAEPAPSNATRKPTAPARGPGPAPAPTKTPASAVVPPLPASTGTPAPSVKIDPALLPAWRALVGLPELGESYRKLIERTGVRLTVGPMAEAWGLYATRQNQITINPRALDDDPRAIAAVLAHEVTHAGQGRQTRADCVSDEVEAFENGSKVWNKFWPNGAPPARTELERHLTDTAELYAIGGPAALRRAVADAYRTQCHSQ